MQTFARRKLRYGLYIPNFGRSAEPSFLSDMALDAERSGWDGFFLWDHLVEYDRRVQLYDSFTTLAAIAVKTKRIRIGTTVTPLPRLKPWAAARQLVTLDHLSKGRVVLGVGLGAKESCDYTRFGEVDDNKVLAEKLDESLDIITGLWTGKQFRYDGKHYRLGRSVFLPRPVQKPRIPIWVAGFWPRRGPFKRVARWDGIIPLRFPGQLMTADALAQAAEFVKSIRCNDSLDIVNIGWTTGVNRRKDAEKVNSFAQQGMTWWLESLYTKRDSPEEMKKRIRYGPPRA